MKHRTGKMNLALVTLLGLVASVPAIADEWMTDYRCESAPAGRDRLQLMVEVQSARDSLQNRLVISQTSMNGIHAQRVRAVSPKGGSETKLRYAGRGVTFSLDLTSGSQSLPPHYDAVISDRQETAGKRVELTCYAPVSE